LDACGIELFAEAMGENRKREREKEREMVVSLSVE